MFCLIASEIIMRVMEEKWTSLSLILFTGLSSIRNMPRKSPAPERNPRSADHRLSMSHWIFSDSSRRPPTGTV